MGKKKQPVYKLVAADSRSPRDGKFIEAIGLYNPLTHPSTLEINEDRALYWLNNGAQPTDTVRNLLSQKGIEMTNPIHNTKKTPSDCRLFFVINKIRKNNPKNTVEKIQKYE